MLFPEELEEVPGHDYERIRSRTFGVPAATIARARDLADALSHREDTDKDNHVEGDAARTELRALYDSIPPAVKADLIADWIGTGHRNDHPAHLFLTWAVQRRDPYTADPVSDQPVAADVDVVDDPEQLWRRLCAVEYRIRIIDGSNDGPVEFDRPTTQEQEEATGLADQLAEVVQIPAGMLRTLAADAAYAHGQDPGTDADPDRFAPPDWEQVRTSEWPRHR